VSKSIQSRPSLEVDPLRHSACFYVVGEIMAALGTQVMSMSGEVVATSLKTIKASGSVCSSCRSATVDISLTRIRSQ
jgi:hypothetical protein